MRWKLGELMSRCKAQGKPITYRELSQASGVSTNTIYMLVNGKASRLDLQSMERLLAYFSRELDRPLTTEDLLEYDRGEPA